jgi:hypothetical protein
MERFLKVFEHRGEKYEIMLVKRLDGTYFLKDFKGGIPFSPFYYCISDLGFIDISIIEDHQEQSVLNFLISQAEEGARHWANNKQQILAQV